MAMSLLLLKKIVILLIMVFMGFISVKQGSVKSEDARIVSKLCFDWVVPCSLINSFLASSAGENMGVFLWSCGVTLAAILFYIAVTLVLRGPLKLNPTEQSSLMFTNSASMALPMTASLLGPENVIFCAPHMGIQNLFLFTLVPWLMGGKGEGGWKKILLNRNLIAIFIGYFLFLTECPLPGVVTEVIGTVGSSIGFLNMLMIGMLMGGVDLAALFRSGTLYFIALLRLILYPLAAILIIRITGMTRWFPGDGTALLVLVMCVSSPVATIVTQMSNLHRPAGEAAQSGSINIFTTLVCCLTMPLMVLVYQLICM